MGIGAGQIILILLVVLIIFGAGKLPKVMGDMGKGVKNFKEGLGGEDEKSEGTAKRIASEDAKTIDATAVEETAKEDKKAG